MYDSILEMCFVELESWLVFQEIIIEDFNKIVIVYEIEMVKMWEYMCLMIEKLKVI